MKARSFLGKNLKAWGSSPLLIVANPFESMSDTEKREREEEEWNAKKKARFNLYSTQRRESRVGKAYQVDPSEFECQLNYRHVLTRRKAWKKHATNVLSRLDTYLPSKKKSTWVLEPVGGCEAKRVTLPAQGSIVVGRNKETQIKDTRISRTHVEIFVDQDVHLASLYPTGDVVSVNDVALLRNAPRRRLERGDIIKLFNGEYGFKLVNKYQKPQSSKAEVACRSEECAGEPLVLEPSSLPPPLAIKIEHLETLHKILIKHRKDFKCASLELDCDMADLMDFFYTVFKPRYPGYDKFKDDMNAAHRRKALENHEANFVVPDDGNADDCHICTKGGELLCCDFCERAYHLYCIHLDAIPEGDWKCPVCLLASEAPSSAAEAPNAASVRVN